MNLSGTTIEKDQTVELDTSAIGKDLGEPIRNQINWRH